VLLGGRLIQFYTTLLEPLPSSTGTILLQ
jgi:hypothetical protein